jgi:hypothetical protein
MRFIAVVPVALLIGSCATPPPAMVWLRADGKPSNNNPVFHQEFDMARTICLGERQKANLSGVAVYSGGLAGAIAAQDRASAADQVQRGCMAEKGYVLVSETDAEVKAAELRAVDLQKKQQGATAAQPFAPPARTALSSGK